MLNINLKLTGVPEKIVKRMIELGMASNKTEAIRLSLFEIYLKNKDLLMLDDELYLKVAKKIDENIKNGKSKVYSVKDVMKKYPELKELI